MKEIIDGVGKGIAAILAFFIIICILVIPLQLRALILEVKKLQAINVEIYKRESKRINKL